MAYHYKPNNYNIYDENLSFEENVRAGAVFTKEHLDILEAAVKRASADFAIGEMSVVDTEEEAHAEVEFDKASGTNFIHIAIPRGPKGDKGDVGPAGPAGKDGVGLTGVASQLTKLADPSSATTQEIATKVNEIIDILVARGICTL